ncbi:helix-turn-helix domain-containing protein [Desulfonatronum thioautotrophicum]
MPQQLAARGFQKTEIAQRLGVSRRAVYYLLHSPKE